MHNLNNQPKYIKIHIFSFLSLAKGSWVLLRPSSDPDPFPVF